jgi:beta-lactam-binding protein with PASTA domain
VPNEVGKTIQAALSDLSAQGWTNVKQPEQVPVTDASQDGIVIQQYPVAGSTFPKTQEITLTVGLFSPPPPTSTTPTSPSTTPSSPSTTPTTPSTTPPTTPSPTPTTTPPTGPGG